MLDDLGWSPTSLGAITMGSGLLGPTIAALVGLAAAGFGARALLRARRLDHSTQPGSGRRRLTVLLFGLLAVLLGVVFLAAADGGLGTGNGVVGSAAAIGLGAVAVALDRLAAIHENQSADAIGATDVD